MTIEQTLLERSGSKCELCPSDTNLTAYAVPPVSDDCAERSVMVCETCRSQIDTPDSMDANHWRCLSESMWSQQPAVQVMAYRLLSRLSSEPWAQDQLDMLYLEDEVKAWADADNNSDDDDSGEPTKDSNGAVLVAGDTVTLIKDLDVKGAGFTAKRGTAVRGISLTNNPEQIEGRVNGVRIVLLTKFLKKSS
ncbi:MAG: PhnA domain-containing protein [Halopseudomonas sp.]